MEGMLGDGLAYWQGDKQITVEEYQTQILGGDVIVKTACSHLGNTNTTYTDKGDCTHRLVCSICTAVADSGQHGGGTATCISGKICDICKLTYTDADPEAHAWIDVSYSWTGTTACTAKLTCGYDASHNVTAEAAITSTEKIPATCTEKGWTTYTASFIEEWAAPQIQDVQDIPVAEHTPAAAVRENEKAATCYAEGSYDELTDHEKSLVEETTKKKLDDLVAALTAYDIIKGNHSKWTKGCDEDLSFTANGPFSKFVGLEVDGEEVAEKYYEAKTASTVITLKKSFLEKLSTGAHTITVIYTDGDASGIFKILAQTETPATGAASNIMLYDTMLTMSLAAMIILLVQKKRKQEIA